MEKLQTYVRCHIANQKIKQRYELEKKDLKERIQTARTMTLKEMIKKGITSSELTGPEGIVYVRIKQPMAQINVGIDDIFKHVYRMEYESGTTNLEDKMESWFKSQEMKEPSLEVTDKRERSGIPGTLEDISHITEDLLLCKQKVIELTQLEKEESIEMQTGMEACEQACIDFLLEQEDHTAEVTLGNGIFFATLTEKRSYISPKPQTTKTMITPILTQFLQDENRLKPWRLRDLEKEIQHSFDSHKKEHTKVTTKIKLMKGPHNDK